MNDRFRELAEQAGMIIIDDEFSTYGKFAEKFAELIVQECSMIAKEIAIKYQDREETYSAGKKAGAFEVARTVKQHFGVEE